MDTPVPPSQAVAGAITEDKTVAILCYVTILGFLAAILLQQNQKTQLGAFHLRQVLGLVLTGLVGGVIGIVPILGLVSALRGDMRPVPILGEHYQRWFAGVFA